VTAVARVYKWEVLKLLAQKRTYLGLGAATLVPLLFVIVLLIRKGGPSDIPLGRYLRQTGLATPFVVLFFMSIWATVTYTAVGVFSMGVVGLVAASVAWGFGDLTSLSGTTVGAWHGLGLLAASLALYTWPMTAIAAFGLMLSTVTRNSAASVVGTLMWALLMQLLGVLPGTEAIRPYLLGTQFDAWHGFLRVPADWTPVVRALWVCAVYVAVPLAAGYLVFLRRDVAGE
jgi:ABC-2 type transport system permease protein